MRFSNGMRQRRRDPSARNKPKRGLQDDDPRRIVTGLSVPLSTSLPQARGIIGGAMNSAILDPGLFNNVERYESLMQVVRNRMTNRAFAPYDVTREHFEMIIEAALHAPSGANAQPWRSEEHTSE